MLAFINFNKKKDLKIIINKLSSIDNFHKTNYENKILKIFLLI